MKVIWSPTAAGNLDDIWTHIAQDNIDAADRMAERLHSASGILTDHPNMGRLGRQHRTRELVVAGTPYILIYTMTPGRIDIVRVIHGKQDWPPKG